MPAISNIDAWINKLVVWGGIPQISNEILPFYIYYLSKLVMYLYYFDPFCTNNNYNDNNTEQFLTLKINFNLYNFCGREI